MLPLRITIPDPCSMRWSDMTPIEEGKRHCGSCDKVITDFTQMSDEELITYFRSNRVLCGKFARHQLDRNIYPRTKVKRGWLSAFLLPALLSFSESSAQPAPDTKVVTHQTDTARLHLRLPIASTPTFRDTTVVYGTVLQTKDSLGGTPVAGAVLTFFLDDGAKQCTSDPYGNFQIRMDSAYLGEEVNVEVQVAGYSTYRTSIVIMQQLSLNTVTIDGGRSGLDDDYFVGENPDTYFGQNTIRARSRRLFWLLLHPLHWFHRHNHNTTD